MMRRLSFWTWTLIGLLAAVASIAMADVLASRFAPRFDVTATGEHRLSPRASAVLGRLPAPARLIVAADLHRVSPEALRDTTDVLDRFVRSGKLEMAMIDIGSPAGPGQYRDVLADLVERDRGEIDAQAAAIRASAATAGELSAWCQTSLSRSLDDLRAALPAGGSAANQQAKSALEQRAAGARIAGRDLAASLGKLEELLSAKIGDIELPATDRAADSLRKEIRGATDQISQIVGELRRLSKQTELGDAFTQRAANAADQIALQRDRLSVLAESLSRLARPGVLRIASALRQSAAAILVPPSGGRLSAIPLNEFFPAQELVLSAGARADNRRRVEEILTAALASSLMDKQPIAVFMHAEEKPWVLDAPFLEKMRENLAMKGIDMVEWAVLLEAEPSGLTRLDPARSRPTVFIAMPPDSTTAARPGEQRGGIDRSQRLGGAVDRLAAEGKNILLCLNPSIQRTYGDADPICTALKRFGLEASTGSPVFTERFADGKREVETDRSVIADSTGKTESALTGALRGLPTILPWPIGIRPDPRASGQTSAQIVPMLTIPAEDSAWGETRWLRVWQTPRSQRALIAETPRFDAGQDERGPWTVAVSAERSESGRGVQRLVVVGSNGWFFDSLTQPSAQVDGRVLAPFPGNQELFDSAIYWLSFADDLIAQSPQSSAVPLIGAIDPVRLFWLRLLIVLGIPLCVLALGVVHRALFG